MTDVVQSNDSRPSATSQATVIVVPFVATIAIAAAAATAVLVSPAFALLGIVGLGLVGGVLANPRVGIIVVLAATMLVPEPFNVAAGPVTVSAGRVMLWALELGWILQLRRPDRPFTPRASPFDGAILVALVTMALSLAVNLPGLDNFELIGGIRQTLVFGVDLFFFFFVVHSVVRTKDDIEWLLKVVGTLVALTALLGLIEHATGRNVFEYVTPYLPQRFQDIFEGIARGSAGGLARGHLSRVRSTFEGPLTFGTVLALGLPVCMALALRARTAGARWRWLLATGLVAAAILLTASRSVYVVAGVTFLIFIAFAPDRRVRRQAFIAGVAVVCFFVSQPAVRDTMTAFFDVQRNGVLEGSLRARREDYGPVLTLVDKKPLFGYAPRSFKSDSLLHSDLLRGRTDLILDNAYLLALAETGVVGVLGLAALLLAAVTAAWRSLRASLGPDQQMFSLALFAALVSWVLMGFAADVYVFGAPPKLFVALLVAVSVLRESSGWSPRRRIVIGGSPQPVEVEVRS